MRRRERFAVFCCCVTLLGVTSLPYVSAWLATSPRHYFLGFVDKVPDSISYLAKMRQGMEGRFFYVNRYSPQEHAPSLVNLFFLLLGHLCRLTHLPLVAGFHLFRLLFAALFLWTLLRFLRAAVAEEQARLYAFVLLCFSSGVDALRLALAPASVADALDFRVPEAITFYTILVQPLFCVANALMLWICLLAARAGSDGQRQATTGNEGPQGAPAARPFTRCWPPVISLALLGFTLAVIHPYDIITLSAVLAAWAVVMSGRGMAGESAATGDGGERRGEAKRVPVVALSLVVARRLLSPPVAVLAGAAPVVLYDRWAFHSNPVLAGWLAQNVTPPPSPSQLLTGYGLLWLLAALGIYRCLGALGRERACRRRPQQPPVNPYQASLWALALCWICATPLLLYTPIPFARKLLQGYHVPLCLFAGIGLQRLFRWRRDSARQRRKEGGGVQAMEAAEKFIVFALLSVTNLALLVGVYDAARLAPQPRNGAAGGWAALRPYRITREERAALRWLETHTGWRDTVLSKPHLGLVTPALAGNRVVVGHWGETPRFAEVKKKVEKFFAPSTDNAWRRRFLRHHGVRYLLIGEDERADWGKQRERLPELREVFHRGNAWVYRVEGEKRTPELNLGVRGTPRL